MTKTNQKKLEETENVTSTKGGFCRMNQCVATYEQTKKEFSYFYPIWIVEANASHILPLQFWNQKIRVNTSKKQPLIKFSNFYSTFLLSVTQWKNTCFFDKIMAGSSLPYAHDRYRHGSLPQSLTYRSIRNKNSDSSRASSIIADGRLHLTLYFFSHFTIQILLNPIVIYLIHKNHILIHWIEP